MAKDRNAKCTIQRRWGKLHKAIFEFSIFSQTQVILEFLLKNEDTGGETVGVMSTFDLQGIESFLQVAAHFIHFCAELLSECLFGAQDLDSRQIIASSDQLGLRRLVESRPVYLRHLHDALRLLSRVMRLQALPKVLQICCSSYFPSCYQWT